MALFIKKETTIVEPPISPELSQTIYGLFKEGKGETEMFKEDAISFADSKTVKDEMTKLETEIRSKCNGTFILEEAIKEDGEITTPAVYFKTTTKTALINSLSSDLLSVETLLDDVIIYNDGEYKEDRTWTEFLALFNK